MVATAGLILPGAATRELPALPGAAFACLPRGAAGGGNCPPAQRGEGAGLDPVPIPCWEDRQDRAGRREEERLVRGQPCYPGKGDVVVSLHA